MSQRGKAVSRLLAVLFHTTQEWRICKILEKVNLLLSPSPRGSQGKVSLRDSPGLPGEDLEGVRNHPTPRKFLWFLLVCCGLEVSGMLNFQPRVAGISNTSYHIWLLT